MSTRLHSAMPKRKNKGGRYAKKTNVVGLGLCRDLDCGNPSGRKRPGDPREWIQGYNYRHRHLRRI
jgi:hypothetical protein